MAETIYNLLLPTAYHRSVDNFYTPAATEIEVLLFDIPRLETRGWFFQWGFFLGAIPQGDLYITFRLRDNDVNGDLIMIRPGVPAAQTFNMSNDWNGTYFFGGSVSDEPLSNNWLFVLTAESDLDMLISCDGWFEFKGIVDVK